MCRSVTAAGRYLVAGVTGRTFYVILELGAGDRGVRGAVNDRPIEMR
jgi:hypothetical protein